MLNFYQNIEPKHLQAFTGKERDSETGLSYFGARYYDSDLMTGWLSVDPMADKYPSLSPYNYCALNPIRVIDPNGDSCVILLASKAVGKAGHMAILVQGKGEDKNWYLYSKNGEGKMVSGIGMGDNDELGIRYSSIEDFKNKNQSEKDNYYTHAYILPTTQEQDEIIRNSMTNELKKEYNLLGSNCSQAVNNSLIAAGVNTNDDPADSFFEQINPFKYLGDHIIPATMYKNIKDANNGYQELDWRER
jgi:RHS repeat-associated protein